MHLFGATSSPIVRANLMWKPLTPSTGTLTWTTHQAVRLSGQLRELLARGGFRLTKWISNDRNVTDTVPVTERPPSVVNLDLKNLRVERTFDVQWDMETDAFNFRIIDEEKAPTRRGILSVVSSI